MNSVKLEIDTLNTIRSALIKQIQTIDKRIESLQNNSKFKCVDCAMVFSSQEKLDKHLVGKKHNDKIGVSPINCSACTNSFYGADLVKHVEDGRCAKSRTCKGCRVIFNTMMRKSRHTCTKRYVEEADNIKNITKKKKLKLTTKNKSLPPVPAAPPPTPEPEPELVHSFPEPVPESVPEKKKESMFVYDPIDYKLGELPDILDNVTPEWYEALHKGIKDGDRYYIKMEEESRCIDNIYEGTPMRLENGIIYEKETGDKWFELKNIDDQYYELIDLDPIVVPPVIWPKLERIDNINNLEPLYTLGERDFDEQSYINLHVHAKDNKMDFLPAEMNTKFNDNISDIMDSKYQDGEFLYYDDGFLCRGDDKLFRFFVHPSRLFYDIEALEENGCDLNSDEELELDETLVENNEN